MPPMGEDPPSGSEGGGGSDHGGNYPTGGDYTHAHPSGEPSSLEAAMADGHPHTCVCILCILNDDVIARLQRNSRISKLEIVIRGCILRILNDDVIAMLQRNSRISKLEIVIRGSSSSYEGTACCRTRGAAKRRSHHLGSG